MPLAPRRTPCLADDHSATSVAYRRGCSCDSAREAWRRDRADYNARRRDPGYRGTRGGGPNLPVTPAERTRRVESLRVRNQRLAVGASRKLRALMRLGHPRARLADALGLTPARVSAICGNSSGSGIWPKTARAVDALFQRLRHTPGGNDATIAAAERLRYLPWQAWKDADIDDPAAVPRWPVRTGPGSMIT